MPLDGYTVAALANEVGQAIVGGRIDKVMQPSSRQVVLTVRNENQNHRVNLRPDPALPGFGLIEGKQENPKQAPGFCMFLRKHLIGGRVLSCATRGFERLVDIRLEQRNELGDLVEKTLVLELLGRQSNLILLNASGVILDALIHVDSQMSRSREVLPARPYVAPLAPPMLGPKELIQAWEDPVAWRSSEAAKAPKDVGFCDWLIQNGFGVSPWLAKGWCADLDLDPATPLAAVPLEALTRLSKRISAWLAADGLGQPALYRQAAKGKWEAHSWQLPHPGWTCVPVTSLSQAVERQLEAISRQAKLQQGRSQLASPVRARLKILKKKERIFADEVAAAATYEQKKENGELILAHLHLIQPGAEAVTVPDYYNPDGGERQIQLHPNRTPSQSAQIYFKQYNKEKKRLETSSQFLARTREELQYCEGFLHALEGAESMDDLKALELEWEAVGRRRGNWAEGAQTANGAQAESREIGSKLHQNELLNPGKPGKRSKRKSSFGNREALRKTEKSSKRDVALPPRRFTTRDGLLLEVGRNNLQNDQLTNRKSAPTDWWFHRKNAPGSHVILHTQGQTPSDEQLVEAAEICAWFSLTANQREALRGTGELGEKVEIDCVPVTRLYKPRGAKPGHVEFTGQTTLVVPAREPAESPDRD